MANPMLQAALEYRKAGLSPIPADPQTKVPTVPWKSYQDQRATEAELRENFKNAKALGLVTGKVSGNLEGFDFDFKAELYEPWVALVEREKPGLISKGAR